MNNPPAPANDAALRLEGTPLERILTRTPADTPATRRYQERLDAWIDRNLPDWDLETGLSRSAPEAKGREATAPLAIAAFCWHCPLSRHRGDPRLLAFFAGGLRTFLRTIGEDGLMTAFGLNGESWAHGWDVEGLIYGLVWCRHKLDAALLGQAAAAFRRSARRHAALAEEGKAIGTVGNQRGVWILGLQLYGQLLGDPGLLALSDRYWEQLLPLVLDASGQVVEQHGPCMHYSYTAFAYIVINLAVRDDHAHDEALARALEWFRLRHTESLYPFAGPTSRQFYERMPEAVIDLLPAARRIASRQPQLLGFAERAVEKSVRTYVSGHGASPWIWAILMADGTDPRTAPAGETAWLDCRATTLNRRSPLAYFLIRRDYQTHFNLTDFMPFSGVQTWAWKDEPPILHPTPLAPSTTQGFGLDTARQGVSHNWGLYGAGAMAPDCCTHPPPSEKDLRFLVARYDWLWRLVFFTDHSTVVLEFGSGGARRTLWTLNRLEPAEPRMEPGIVRFEGREGCLYSTVAAPPAIESLDADDPWARGVRQLRYDCGDGPAAFALSNGAFRFHGPPPSSPAPWRFEDGSGLYEITLDPRFFQPNPGNFRFDVWQLALGTTARRA